MTGRPPLRAWAPGRVNLIGEHTDYTGGLVFPMAIQLGTVIEGERRGTVLELRSDQQRVPARVPLPVGDPGAIHPPWARYPAAVAAELGATEGFVGTVTSTVPLGSGLSSSASLEVSTALALGAPAGDPDTAELCRRAETAATGVPCGIMDQLASVAGVEGHALLIDCRTLEVTPSPVPAEARFVVVHSGQNRALAGSAYGERRAQCEAAQQVIGPLRDASPADVGRRDDPTLAARARHVIGENRRVVEFATALAAGDLATAGEIMVAGHRSLAEDFEVSTDVLDALVDELVATPGVHGARLTGAGFGGCVVALCEPAVDLGRGWVVTPSSGARLL